MKRLLLALLLATLPADYLALEAATKTKCQTCPRDRHGRIIRSESAKHAFMRQTGYPHGRPGFVVDHVVPLACGGSDTPQNMAWQSVADAKAKDKWERKGCTP
jgi:hypothetical protein